MILIMWALAAVGMSIYGIRRGAMDSNQIHILFAPLMAAYGLAMVSILWARLSIQPNMQAFKNAHLILVVLISAGPMMLSLPKSLKQGFQAEGYGGFPHYPPYFPKAFNRILADNTTEKDVIISDTPWAIAWYADRISVWLPKDLDQIKEVEEIASNQKTPIQGIVISPYSFNHDKILSTGAPGKTYGELFPLVYNAFGMIGARTNFSFIDINPQFKSLSQRYPYKIPLFSRGYIMYYSNGPIKSSKD